MAFFLGRPAVLFTTQATFAKNGIYPNILRNFQQIKVLILKILKNGRKVTEKWQKCSKSIQTKNDGKFVE
jgi:hypothetical protein